MERDTLSMRQLMALLWAGILGPAAELLPGTTAHAGGAGAVGLALAGGGMLLSGWMLWHLTQENQGLARGFLDAFGPVFGKAILFIYMVWFQLLLTVRLRLSAQRLMGGGTRDGAVWFFIGVLGLMALWLARGRLGAFGRTGELMFVVLAATGAAVLVLALSQVRGENFLADWDWSWDGLRLLIAPGMSVLSCGLFAAFLVQPNELTGAGRKWVGWTVSGILSLILAQTIALGVFGPELTSRLTAPFFQMAKGVGVEGAFQRIESVVVAVWSFSDLILLGGTLWAMRKIGGALWPKVAGSGIVTASVLLGMIGAVVMFGRRISVEQAAGWAVPVGGTILAFGVPLLAIITKKTKGKL